MHLPLRFGSDWDATIERNRRRSPATLRISRLRSGPRWPEDEMENGSVISSRVLRPERVTASPRTGTSTTRPPTSSLPVGRQVLQLQLLLARPEGTRTLRVQRDNGSWMQRTPAMAAGLASHVWTLQEW